MILTEELVQSDIGRKVIYHEDGYEPEEGELTGWTANYVFVRFKRATGEACRPEDVSFIGEPE